MPPPRHLLHNKRPLPEGITCLMEPGWLEVWAGDAEWEQGAGDAAAAEAAK